MKTYERTGISIREAYDLLSSVEHILMYSDNEECYDILDKANDRISITYKDKQAHIEIVNGKEHRVITDIKEDNLSEYSYVESALNPDNPRQ